MKYRVSVEKTFEKSLKSLPPHRAKAAVTAVVQFSETPDLPKLRFRQLSGTANHFIISASGGDRVILRKDGPDLFAAVDTGPHDNVYRRWDR